MRHCEPAALEKVDSGRLMVTWNDKEHKNSSKVSPSLSLFLPSPFSLSLSLLLIVSFCRKNGTLSCLLQVHVHWYTLSKVSTCRWLCLPSACSMYSTSYPRLVVVLGSLAPRVPYPVNIKQLRESFGIWQGTGMVSLRVYRIDCEGFIV